MTPSQKTYTFHSIPLQLRVFKECAASAGILKLILCVWWASIIRRSLHHISYNIGYIIFPANTYEQLYQRNQTHIVIFIYSTCILEAIENFGYYRCTHIKHSYLPNCISHKFNPHLCADNSYIFHHRCRCTAQHFRYMFAHVNSMNVFHVFSCFLFSFKFCFFSFPVYLI